MNQNGFKNIQFNLSGLSTWLTIFAIIWLLGAIGLGWLVKSLVILLGLLLIAPVIAVLGFRWWLKRNVVESRCPVCSNPLAGINGMQLNCPSCGEPLVVQDRVFQRITPPGTVDVQVVDVQVVDTNVVDVRQLED